MGLGDWLVDTIEEKGRKIARRGDALFGCEEYEDASLAERLIGLSGGHSKGTFKKQKEKKKRGIKSGDIVAVSRGLYDHYGIYINKHEVISYTSDKSDIGDNLIQSTSFERFLRGAREYSVLVFPDQYAKPDKVKLASQASFSIDKTLILDHFLKHKKKHDYKLYSATKTVERARSRLGEDSYNLVFNNCEHFAIWCKTGIEESHQVNNIIKFLIGTTRVTAGKSSKL
ncbi:lecithin retinol acyltransferase family protein [Vibrio clamense]|uniref:lecithin retinol acyltransferase family protein n=1 Tax=Vibrio TaxID=662 RepID=UPI0014828192|nr:lecithin retinol acyltransferase family protein [Vibrio genomosp. F6]